MTTDGATYEVKKFDSHSIDERTKSVTIHREKVEIGMLVTCCDHQNTKDRELKI
jgi:hypothetical protein